MTKHSPPTIIITETESSNKLIKQHESIKIMDISPLFPKRLAIVKSPIYRDFDLIGELQNLCIKIPLLQAIKEIPTYAKTIKELCVNKARRKPRKIPTAHVLGKLSDLILGKHIPIKYDDLGNHVVTVHIQGHNFPNTLVDLGVVINIITLKTCGLLGITRFKLTPAMLELADIFVVKPEGTLDDIIISVDSWEYLVDFLVLNPKNNLEGHPLILGRPWLATANTYIGC